MQGGHKMSETVENKVEKKVAFFARYINRYGRRNMYTKLGRDGIRRSFADGEWVEVHPDDARWFESQAKDNATWEFKTDEVVLETEHNYVIFLGVGTKTVLEIPQYDKDEYGDAILKTKRDYKLPKDVWIFVNPKDAQYFRRMASVNDFVKFEEIKLPTTIQPPIKFSGQTPEQYQIDVYADIRESGALKGGSILFDKVIGVKTEVREKKEVVEVKAEKTEQSVQKPRPKKKKKKVKKKPVKKEENN
jgi:hypothetical protein|tara:strand:+ start:78 stop:818 length:741 start_codon:yes stop_codon:yes gene_type:complete